MESQRLPLDRAAGDVEVGVFDAAGNPGYTKQPAPHAGPPRWLRNFEKRRPVWIVELFAEFLGVFIYTYCGVGATAAFTVSTADKLVGYGAVLNIGIAYAFGIAFAVTIAAPVSGGHLSPGYTVAFILLRGFPIRKALQYIVAQILGGFVAVLCVYGQYKQDIDLYTAGIMELAAGSVAAADAEIFSPFGPAGILAIYPTSGSLLRYVFLNELIATIILAVIVFTIIDPTNPFVHISSGAMLIGGAYLTMIIAFSGATVALNTARDLGGRLGCAVIFGRAAFTSNKGYSALAALTNILGTIIGGAIHTFWLTDHRRPIVTQDPGSAAKHAAAPSYSNETVATGPISGLDDKQDRFTTASAIEHREYLN